MSYLNPLSEAQDPLPMGAGSFRAALKEWAMEAPAGITRAEKQDLQEKKNKAVHEIELFLRDPDATYLNLSNMGLSSLPPIFHPEVSQVFAKRLQDLNLMDNHIDELPSQIGQLQALKTLLLDGNALRELPAEFVELHALEKLHLRENKLERLPVGIHQLQQLKNLDLKSNNLEELPLEIGELRDLRVLNLANNHLKSLPPTLNHCQKLTFLNISDNELMVFPQVISELRRTDIFLGGNKLHLMPLHPFDLTHREEEDARRVIDLNKTEIPFALRNMLDEASRQPGYAGPQLILPDKEKRVPGEPRLLHESLKDLFFLTQTPAVEFPKLLEDEENADSLATWLARISDILQTKVGEEGDPFLSEERKSLFCKKILSYMELAEKDPQFRALFFAIVSEAIQTCGDRAILSILRMGTFYQLATIDRSNMHALADFLIRGPWAIKQLEMLADSKIAQLRLEREEQKDEEEELDEVEIYLAYPILLKERLALFLDVNEMLYPSDVIEEDLQTAEAAVDQALSSPDARYEILSKDEVWRNSLEKKFPQEFGALTAEKERALVASENPDYVAIEEIFMRGVVELTRVALKAEEGSFHAALEQWAREAPGESRQRAINKIQHFLMTPDADSLDFSNLGLSSLPPIFHPEVLQTFATRLKTLNVDGNHLDVLPPEISELKALEGLFLENNQLRTLPPEIGQLQALRSLSVGKNNLQALPHEIGLLQSLEWLNLEYNQLQTLPPEIDQLQALEELFLTHNELQAIPPEIGSLRALQKLHMGNNHLQELPPEIDQLQALKELFIEHNQLQAIPPEIGQLRALQKLDVGNNHLQELPPEIDQLQALEELFIEHNQLEEIPPELCQLQALNTLNLSDNKLRALPAEIGQLRALKTLNLSDNSLQVIPPEIGLCQELEWLSFEENRLQEIPSEIGELQKLGELKLNNNHLRSLPSSIVQVQTLHTLDLSHNTLLTLPEEFIQLQIVNLNLSNNPLFDMHSLCFDLTPREGDDKGQIDLRETKISFDLRNMLQETSSAPNYAGPVILLP